MAEKEAPEAARRLHVTVLLVASRRALDNALEELGFAEDDDRVIEHDGRLAFLTCTHEEDCDDPPGARRAGYRAHPAPRLAPAAGRGNCLGRGEAARCAARDPAQRHARR